MVKKYVINKDASNWLDFYNEFVGEFRRMKGLVKIELGAATENSIRTIQQNKALHKFFEIIAQELNNKGEPFVCRLLGKEVFKEWSAHLVKEFIWRPLQIKWTKKKSTTKLKSDEIDKIAQPIIDFLGHRFEIFIEFPSKDHV